MTARFRSLLLLALLVGASVALGRLYWSAPFHLEISMQSDRGGTAQLYQDLGRGLNEADSTRLPLKTGGRYVAYRFPLPAGKIDNLRFDPTDRGGGLQRIRWTRIVDRAGSTVREFPLSGYVAAQEVDKLEATPAGLEIGTPPDTYDAVLALQYTDELTLKPTWRAAGVQFLKWFVPASALVFLLGVGTGPLLAAVRWVAGADFTRRPVGWAREHPRSAICLIAALATLGSCYPVVFFGKSFVSPNNHSGTLLLYGRMPTLPGYNDPTTDDEKGADLGAIQWYSVPTAVVEREAVFQRGELPLWNRYNSTGLPLLGQGQSMFGDPLHGLVLLMGATSGWWDFKFVVAKAFFAGCIGIAVWLASRHLGAALLLAASAPFIGFFSYRYAHPAFFSFCYAPAVLVCWLRLISADTRREVATTLLLLMGANWLLMCSGTVKEAYMQILGMNAAGVLALLLTRSRWQTKLGKLGGAMVSGVLFIGVSAPLWWSFLRALAGARTAYDGGGVYQLQPGLLAGLFDDIFYRQFNAGEDHLDPSANFLVLLGVAWFAARRFSGGRSHGPEIALALAAAGVAALVFGVIPPEWILHLPFIRQIIHVDNTFSCVLLVLLLVLAGCGARDFFVDARAGDGFRRSYVLALFVVVALLGAYLGTAQAAQRSTRTFLHISEQVPFSAFFDGYALTLLLAAALLPWLGKRLISGRAYAPLTTFGLALALGLLHWRQGMHLGTPFDPYVMNPHERVNLLATSPALEFVRGRQGEPARVTGLGTTLFPGYNSSVRLESVDGPDALFDPAYRDLMEAAGFPLDYGIWRFQIDAKTIEAEMPFLNLLNVRAYLGDPQADAASVPPAVLTPVGSFDLKVYESAGTWPRAFFVDQIESYDGEAAQFAEMVRYGDGTPFAAMKGADLATRPDLAPLASHAVGVARQVVPATNYRLTSNATELEIVAPSAGVAVLTELFVDGDVQVLVNGRRGDCLRVNHAFRGVHLPAAGTYRLRFRYWPRHFNVALWASALSLVATGGLWWWQTRRRVPSRAASMATETALPAPPRTRDRHPVPDAASEGALIRKQIP